MEQFEANWERITDEDDPRRCQHNIPTIGQCRLVKVENSEYCPAHGGNKAFEAAKKESLRNYRLNKFKVRIQELGDSSVIFSLKEEIAILRILIEEKINKCNDETDLLLISGPLSDLIMKSEKLVTSCNRLEGKLGNLLDRTKLLQYAQTIISIISNYVSNDQLEIISDEISEALSSL